MFLFADLTLVDNGGMSAERESVPPICDAIRTARAAVGTTQTALAELLDVTQAQVSLWERSREPGLDAIRAIEEALEPGRLKGWLLRAA